MLPRFPLTIPDETVWCLAPADAPAAVASSTATKLPGNLPFPEVQVTVRVEEAPLMTAEEFATYKSMEVLVEGAYGLPSAFAAPQPLTCMPRRVVLVVLGSVAIDFFFVMVLLCNRWLMWIC